MFNIMNIIILLVLIVGGIFLQIFLSKKENKWLGLILPIITLTFSLIAVLGVSTYSTQTATVQQTSQDEEGTLIEETVIEEPNNLNIGETIFQVIIVFVLYNIPTLILLAIYFACREKIKRHSMLDKMNIQDLE